MQLTLKITGRRCDLALHPISPKTARDILVLGRKFYTKKYIHWWRNGNTSTCGMLLGDEHLAEALFGEESTPLDLADVSGRATPLRRERYMESRARHLALLGYDDELCYMTWTWHGISAFDPAAFTYEAHRWDHVTGEKDYVVLESVRYDGRCADEEDWDGSTGFTLVDPRVLDLDVLRLQAGCEARASRKTVSLAKWQARAAEPACEPAGAALFLPVSGHNATGEAGNAARGNMLQVDLHIRDDVVVQAGGMAVGCEYCKQSLEALVEMVTGRSVQECFLLANEDLHPYLTRVQAHLDCDTYAMSALKLAVRDWERRRAA